MKNVSDISAVLAHRAPLPCWSIV